MRTLLLLALALVSGCVGGTESSATVDDQVRVSAINAFDGDAPIHIQIAWGDVVWFDENVLVAPGERAITSFERPCERLGAGTVTYTATLWDETTMWSQVWSSNGCAEQHIVLHAAGDGLEWAASYS